MLDSGELNNRKRVRTTHGIFHLLNTRVRVKSRLADNSEQQYSIYQLKVNRIKLKLKAVNNVLELCEMWKIF